MTVGFPNNNAVVAVLYTARGDKDMETVNLIREKMAQLNVEALSEQDKAYFEAAFALANG